eukprot:3862526-Alexandrium_andersonii.AAC.1
MCPPAQAELKMHPSFYAATSHLTSCDATHSHTAGRVCGWSDPEVRGGSDGQATSNSGQSLTALELRHR